MKSRTVKHDKPSEFVRVVRERGQCHNNPLHTLGGIPVISYYPVLTPIFREFTGSRIDDSSESKNIIIIISSSLSHFPNMAGYFKMDSLLQLLRETNELAQMLL